MLTNVSFKYSHDGGSAIYSNARFAHEKIPCLTKCTILSDSAVLKNSPANRVHATNIKYDTSRSMAYANDAMATACWNILAIGVGLLYWWMI